MKENVRKGEVKGVWRRMYGKEKLKGYEGECTERRS